MQAAVTLAVRHRRSRAPSCWPGWLWKDRAEIVQVAEEPGGHHRWSPAFAGVLGVGLGWFAAMSAAAGRRS
jgi:hypothetical protein